MYGLGNGYACVSDIDTVPYTFRKKDQKILFRLSIRDIAIQTYVIQYMCIHI